LLLKINIFLLQLKIKPKGVSMVSILTHIALHVKDPEACISFYQRYAQLSISHERKCSDTSKRIVWLSEPGKEREFIFVILPGGPGRNQASSDFSHLGFALESKEAVDKIAEMAEQEGILLWPSCDNPYPVGYYCGVKDPDGNAVEFSYGQPLGPGAEQFIQGK
jgi:catechol 2,3-dioxygenase-like lactoylglutathione lyase family enzyme